jgi:glycosyltransferase involved in cell wall biosynthesis
MDMRNPGAGGAERYCWELAHRFARDGAAVTWICSRFEGAPERDQYDGVEVYRMGTPVTIHVFAGRFARRLPKFDLLIESIVSAPYFLARVGARNRICLFYHMPTFRTLARRLGPLSILAFGAQALLLPAFYGKETIVTDGPSTREELLKRGFTNVHIAEDGLENTGILLPKRNLVVVTGPLKPWKRIDHAISAFAYLDDSWKLDILGNFQERAYRAQVERIVARLGLRGRVSFLGHVPEETKFRQYAEAKLAIIASEREGWSLPGLESAAYGCVSVGYDVPGVRDALVDGETSLLVPSGNVEMLGEALKRVASDGDLWQKLSVAGARRAAGFSWEVTYRKIREVVRGSGETGPL